MCCFHLLLDACVVSVAFVFLFLVSRVCGAVVYVARTLCVLYTLLGVMYVVYPLFVNVMYVVYDAYVVHVVHDVRVLYTLYVLCTQ